MKKFKKTLAWVLSLAMVMTMIPMFTVMSCAGDGNVCTLNGTPYATVQDAVDAAPDGVKSTIVLIDSIDYSSVPAPNPISGYSAITIPEGKNIVLDMAGFSIINDSENFISPLITVEGTLVITGNGTIENSYFDGVDAIMSLGNLTVENGNFYGSSIALVNFGNLTINGGYFNSGYMAAVYNVYNVEGELISGLLTINGGVFVGEETPPIAYCADTIINGGMFNGPDEFGNFALFAEDDGVKASLTVNGGYFNSNSYTEIVGDDITTLPMTDENVLEEGRTVIDNPLYDENETDNTKAAFYKYTLNENNGADGCGSFIQKITKLFAFTGIGALIVKALFGSNDNAGIELYSIFSHIFWFLGL